MHINLARITYAVVQMDLVNAASPGLTFLQLL